MLNVLLISLSLSRSLSLAHRSLVSNLITRFQRTSLTAPDFVLVKTPRYGPQSTRNNNENDHDDHEMDTTESLQQQQGQGQRNNRKRNINESKDSSLSTTQMNDFVIDAVVAVILLVIESNSNEVNAIMKSLQRDSLADLNNTIASILATKKL